MHAAIMHPVSPVVQGSSLGWVRITTPIMQTAGMSAIGKIFNRRVMAGNRLLT